MTHFISKHPYIAFMVFMSLVGSANFLFGGCSSHEEVKKPAITSVLAQEQWLDLVNEKAAQNANGSFEAGDRCFADIGAPISVVKDLEDLYVVQYDKNEERGGTHCPRGAQFRMAKLDFLHQKSQYLEEMGKRRFMLDHARRLAAHPITSPEEPIDHWERVTIMNENTYFDPGIRSWHGVVYGDRCGIYPEGTMKYLGTVYYGNMKLYEFHVGRMVRDAAECSNGTLFLKLR
jgi:hypothetical protein